MKTKKFIIYINKVHEEEQALVDVSNKDINIILMGDYYHDKIDEKIEGFFIGLNYCNVEYKKVSIEISPNGELFYTLGFNDYED